MVEIIEKNFVYYSINSDIVDYWTTNLLKRYSMILMTHTIDLLLEKIGLFTHVCKFFRVIFSLLSRPKPCLRYMMIQNLSHVMSKLKND